MKIRSRFFPQSSLAVLVFAALPVLAQEAKLGETVVSASPLRPAADEELAAKRTGTGDTATLLENTPGVSIYTGGGVSGLPVIHGMADDRIKLQVDGMEVTSACSNHMNPALSYIDPTNVAKISVMAGITPVSAGGDSIGGSIRVESAPPRFATAGGELLKAGSVSASYRSNTGGAAVAATGTLASENTSVTYTGAIDSGDSYKDGNGTLVKATLYESRNQAVTVGLKGSDNLLVIRAGQQTIPYEGFVNQRMDLVGNHVNFLNMNFTGQFGWGRLDARAYLQDTRHAMNFFTPEKTGFMPMDTHGQDAGYALKAELPLSSRDTLRVGHEFHHFKLDDWWAPVSQAPTGMAPNTFQNIHHGVRDRFSLFAEMDSAWTQEWSTSLGIRGDIVMMNTGEVQGYNNTQNNYATDAAAFNALNRRRRDNNIDLTAMARYEASQTSDYEFGYARKTRSPNLYERYSWSTGTMASNMITWFGDGNGYVGNPDLRPEVAHTLSATAGWHDGKRSDWEFKATPYYTYVKDHIGADLMATNTANTYGRFRFANHDARIYGLDLSGKAGVWDNAAYGRGELKGVVGYVRGKTVDSGVGLYHMMPLNLRLTLEQTLNVWTNAIETQWVQRKGNVDTARFEQPTGGYALVNLRTSYQWQKDVRLDLGVTNLFDKFYYLPLGGANVSEHKYNGYRIGALTPVPGQGRSVNVGVTMTF